MTGDGSIQELAELLARLPGVGRRTAIRLAFHLLRSHEDYAVELGAAIASLHQRVQPCSICANLSDDDPCSICTDPGRDERVICVVATVPDLWAVEQSANFRGRYHVLGGLLKPLDGVGPDDLNLDRLVERAGAQEIDEVILATRPSVEGEATALLIRQILDGTGVTITRIASGIPHGGELEYADRITLGRAIDDRREM